MLACSRSRSGMPRRRLPNDGSLRPEGALQYAYITNKNFYVTFEENTSFSTILAE